MGLSRPGNKTHSEDDYMKRSTRGSRDPQGHIDMSHMAIEGGMGCFGLIRKDHPDVMIVGALPSHFVFTDKLTADNTDQAPEGQGTAGCWW